MPEPSVKDKIVCLLGISIENFVASYSPWIDFTKTELEMLESDSSEEDICNAVADATILFAGPGRPPITRAIIEAAPRLKLIQMPGTGYNEVDLQAARGEGVYVATTKGANASAVAEHAITFMLILLKKSLIAHEGTSSGGWPQMDTIMRMRTWELGSRTVGLVGFGATGRKVAEILQGFGSNVIYHTRNRLSEDEERSLGVEYTGLNDLLSRSDVVSLHVPLTPETRGMIGRDEVALMRRGAILINTSRGGVVDEEAVVDAIKKKRLGGAGFDVFDSEPLASDNIFAGVENVILSPHIGGGTMEGIQNMSKFAGRNIALVLDGGRPINVVNDM
jgi:phosphoglycerate dehydrogenase-like enzyme